MALDKVSAAMMSPLSVSETAPSNPAVGQRWYRASTAVTYQYTNDGTSSFWLDISSGGIGTSAERGVDFVGDTDPIATTNGTGLAFGSVYYNRENNRHFVCTDATNNANVWSGRFTATGGTITTYSGYKVHTFTSSGFFAFDSTSPIDYLVVAGGGGGGASAAGTAGVQSGNVAGAGGAGTANAYRTGSNVTYAGGGGGGSGSSGTLGQGGAGGGGTGGKQSNASPTAGTANTGGGGGGALDGNGAAGGSGIVVIRYAV